MWTFFPRKARFYPRKLRKCQKNDSRITLADIGLSESSDVEEGASLSKYGRNIKRKLDATAEEERETKRSSWREPSPIREKSSFADLISTSAASQKAVNTKKPAAKSTVLKCIFSGYMIRDPLITQDHLGALIGDRRTVKLNQIVLRDSSFNRENWVTFAVVTSKLPPKTGKNGKQFGIWNIIDLEETGNIASLFLFGEAQSDCWKISPGNAIAILNANIMPKREDKSQLAISIANKNQLVEIGTSDDLVYCKGHAKSGEACRNMVNKSKCSYCVYHLKAAFQKVSSQRMDLQANWSGTQPKAKSKLQEVSDEFFYDKKMFGAPNIFTQCSKVKNKPFQGPITKEAQALIDESRDLIRKQLKTEKERDTLNKLTFGNDELCRFMVSAGPGSKNLIRVLTSSEKQLPKAISASDLLKSQQSSMQKLFAAHKEKALGNMNALPRLTLGSSFQSASCSVASSSTKLPVKLSNEGNNPRKFSASVSNPTPNVISKSQARALAKLKQTGTAVNKDDPNKMKQRLSAVARDHIQQVLAAVPPQQTAVEIPAPVKNKVCNLQDDPEIQALLKETSQHEDLCQISDINYMGAYFENASVKEGIEEQMEKTTEIPCTTVTCKQCKYTAASLAERCVKENHIHVRHKAIKKFFQCKKCRKRKPSFSFLPSPCKSCGNESFKRCGMLGYERQGPKLETENLLLRGDEEPKFLNSLR